MPVFAPMPSAKAAMATKVKPGFLTSSRKCLADIGEESLHGADYGPWREKVPEICCAAPLPIPVNSRHRAVKAQVKTIRIHSRLMKIDQHLAIAELQADRDQSKCPRRHCLQPSGHRLQPVGHERRLPKQSNACSEWDRDENQHPQKADRTACCLSCLRPIVQLQYYRPRPKIRRAHRSTQAAHPSAIEILVKARINIVDLRRRFQCFTH